MGWLPVMLQVEGLLCVVIGGGEVAERKVNGLLEADAHVTIVSPSMTDKLVELAEQGIIHWITREYMDGDLAGASLAIAATNDREANERVALEAEARGVWPNVADDAAASAVLLPSVFRRGKLVIAVSTTGASPSMARRVRRELEERYGPEYESWLDWLAEARLLLRRLIPETERRQSLHRALEEIDGAMLLSARLPIAGWQQRWLDALEREPTPEGVRRLASQA
jgi:precorrin-2 dehydrogenase / sirohydrochlorin ferrochelatase